MLHNEGVNTPWKGGFHITFANGCTVSIQFRASNYCEHHKDLFTGSIDLYRGPSKDAEVAAWTKDEKWITLPDWGDNVKGYQTPAQILQFMNYVAGLK